MAQPIPPTAIVVPVFNDWASLLPLAKGIAAAMAEHRPRLVVVDDGSSEPGPDLELLAHTGLAGEILRLHRNCGHQQAIAVGLCHVVARGGAEAIAVMDGDAPLGFRLFYRLYGFLFRLMTGQHLGFGNFCALGPAAAQRVVHMAELTIHVAATLLIARLPIRRLPIDRGPRYDGSSKMSFVSLTSHGLRSIAVFGETVLTRIVIAAVWIAGVGALALLIVFAMKLMGVASPGWTTTVFGVVLGVVLQIAVAGLLGLFVILRGRRTDPGEPDALARSMIARIEPFGPV